MDREILNVLRFTISIVFRHQAINEVRGYSLERIQVPQGIVTWVLL
jgi:hypothetical protein